MSDDLNINELAKLKVTELRAELQSRGLDTKGVKAVLVDRLAKALQQDEKAAAEPEQEAQEAPPEEPSPPTPEPEPAPQPTPPKVKEEPKPMITEPIKQEPVTKVEPAVENSIKTEVKTPTTDTQVKVEQRGIKRPRSVSPGTKEEQPKRVSREDEPDYDFSKVLLDWYNSDLALQIDRQTFSIGTPLSEHGWGYVWSGVRATYGFLEGKVWYEVKILEYHDVSHLDDEPIPNVLRVGWSTDDTSMQLGEELHSYGYGGTGKSSTNCQFKDYGGPFGEGDVVGAFLDCEGSKISMYFTVNGEDKGLAYEINKASLNGKPLFPHILTKNCKFQVNFGERMEGSFFPLTPHYSAYTYAGDIPMARRERGTAPPEKREDCEMIMMCGLPGCGKTTWAENYAKLHPNKKYYILGTNFLIEKMKVMGLPRKRNYAGRWDVLIEKCTKCLNKLLQMGASRRRNYILDQTNVYPSAQKRKMRGFVGFRRRAIVMVPTEEEFKRRVEKQVKEEGKDVPESAVLEMKANFKLPEVGEIFESVEYVELPEKEARALVEKYNQEGRDAGYLPPAERKFKGNSHGNRGSNRNNRGSWQLRGGWMNKWGQDRYEGSNSSSQRSGRGNWSQRSGGWQGGGRSNWDRSNRGWRRQDNEWRSGGRDWRRDKDRRDRRDDRYQQTWSGSSNQWGDQESYGGSGGGGWGGQGSWNQGGYSDRWGGSGGGGGGYNDGYGSQGQWSQGYGNQSWSQSNWNQGGYGSYGGRNSY